MTVKDVSSFSFQMHDGMEFSSFVDSVLAFIYGTLTLGERGRVISITLGVTKQLDKNASTRVAHIRARSVVSGGRFHYYVGLSVQHSDLTKWKVEWRSVLMEGAPRPPSTNEIIWVNT